MENIQDRAIVVRSEVRLDHFELGKLFSEWDNNDQHLFLLGMLAGLENLGQPYQGIQLQLIVEAAEANGGRDHDLEILAELLTHYFKKTDK